MQVVLCWSSGDNEPVFKFLAHRSQSSLDGWYTYCDLQARSIVPSLFKTTKLSILHHISLHTTMLQPLLHHLNADTSWLLQIPRPDSASSSTSSRRYFNVIFDPWLSGTQSDVASWFSKQWHAIEPAYSSIRAVEELCLVAEPPRADEATERPTRPTNGHSISDVDQLLRDSPASTSRHHSPIDAVAISHEFTDHCHKQTLLELPPTVPVYAAAKAAKLIRGWKHFDHVVETPNLDPAEASRASKPSGNGEKQDRDRAWKGAHRDPIPPWVVIGRLQKEGDGLYYHSAVVVAWDRVGDSGAPTGQ